MYGTYYGKAFRGKRKKYTTEERILMGAHFLSNVAYRSQVGLA